MVYELINNKKQIQIASIEYFSFFDAARYFLFCQYITKNER